jgi:hypothetical protein
VQRGLRQLLLLLIVLLVAGVAVLLVAVLLVAVLLVGVAAALGVSAEQLANQEKSNNFFNTYR